MQGYSSSFGGADVLAYEPPLSPPAPAGRPSLVEAPTPVIQAPEAAPPGPAWEADRELEPTPIEAGLRRIVVRLLGGEEVEYAEADDREIAVEAARELTRGFAEAEGRGEWRRSPDASCAPARSSRSTCSLPRRAPVALPV